MSRFSNEEDPLIKKKEDEQILQSFILNGTSPLEDVAISTEYIEVVHFIDSDEIETFPTIRKFYYYQFLGWWLLSVVLTPIYVLVTLAKEQRLKREKKTDDIEYSAKKKLFLVTLSLIYYALLITYCIGGSRNASYSYALLLHAMCCGVESMVRSARIVPVDCSRLEGTAINIVHNADPHRTNVKKVANVLLKMEPQAITNFVCLLISLLGSALYTIVPWFFGLELTAWNICGLLVNFSLCLVALLMISKTLLQLYQRLLVAREYQQLTIRRNDYYLDLSHSWENVVGWLSLKSYLLTRSRQPQTRLATEIILSAVFLLLLPLWIMLIFELFIGRFTESSALSLCICTLLGVFLLASVYQASAIQKIYRDTMPLKSAQLRALLREKDQLKHTGEPLFHDSQLMERFVSELKLLESILGNQQEGVLFFVLGIPINERMVMMMLGFLASVLSTGFTELTTAIM